VAKVYPAEFRDDVVRAARKNEAPINQIARDFGISEATLHNLNRCKSKSPEYLDRFTHALRGH